MLFLALLSAGFLLLVYETRSWEQQGTPEKNAHNYKIMGVTSFSAYVLLRCQTSSLTPKLGFLAANFPLVNTLAEIRTSVRTY